MPNNKPNRRLSRRGSKAEAAKLLGQIGRGADTAHTAYASGQAQIEATREDRPRTGGDRFRPGWE